VLVKRGAINMTEPYRYQVRNTRTNEVQYQTDDLASARGFGFGLNTELEVRDFQSDKCSECSDNGSGYLLDQSYGEAEIPEGWTPVQACDTCQRFATDEAAAHYAARRSSWAPCFFPSESDGPGDWAARIPKPPKEQNVTNLYDQHVQSFTNERLALDLNQVASNVRTFNPEERAARLREAARRLVNTSLTLQAIVTLEDGHQVAFMHGNVHHRSTIGGSWALPMSEATRPHQPGTWYRGEW
jgi:hypothetical protein